MNEHNPLRDWLLSASVFVTFLILFAGVILLFTALAEGSEIEVEELDGEPFARISIVNTCTDYGDKDFIRQTKMGPVSIKVTEGDNGCGDGPDTYRVVKLPDGVIAEPMELELIEDQNNGQRSEPAFIELYSAVF